MALWAPWRRANTVPVLVQGLQRLEYRGYDSCGLAIQQSQGLQRSHQHRARGQLQAQVQRHAVHSEVGIAHTRWATRTAPRPNTTPTRTLATAQTSMPPRLYAPARVALVPGSIIRNHETLRRTQCPRLCVCQ